MKIYIVHLKNPDTNQFDQFLGAFDSAERCKNEIRQLSKEIDYEFKVEDFEIFETELNKNWLIGEQIMK